jgi:hypothetical protein
MLACEQAFIQVGLVIINASGIDGEASETESRLGELTVDVAEVENYLRSLDITKASGPDKIPARLLKECDRYIAPSLCELFNVSLRVGRLPVEWKSANVTPVHKKHLKEPAENYRPISLFPIIAKLLERCVCRRLYEHVISAISLDNTVSYAIDHALHNCCKFYIRLEKTLTVIFKQTLSTWILPMLFTLSITV